MAIFLIRWELHIAPEQSISIWWCHGNDDLRIEGKSNFSEVPVL